MGRGLPEMGVDQGVYKKDYKGQKKILGRGEHIYYLDSDDSFMSV